MLKYRILVVEDETHISEGLKLNLELLGHETLVADTGTKGVEFFTSFKPHLIILDLMLPEIDGFKVLEMIREKDSKVPILILSAKDQAKDKVHCFTKGVDDYLTKPFNLDEFLLRVARMLERVSWNKKDKEEKGFMDDEFSFQNIQIDFLRAKALKDEEEIKLTSQELKLLRVFFEAPGIPLARAHLLERAWGYTEDTSTRTLDNFIVRFRKYFENNPKEPIHFMSVRSVGYQFNP